MDQLMANEDRHGRLLPTWWINLSYSARAQFVAYYKCQAVVPDFWKITNLAQRQQVLNHLVYHGILTAANRDAYIAKRKELEQQRLEAGKVHIFCYGAGGGGTSDVANLARMQIIAPRPFVGGHFKQEESRLHRGMLYPPARTPGRILPSLYTKLTNIWTRASGLKVAVKDMNQGHLKATVNLLNESHTNLIDKMADLLGKMHNHLGNRPDLQTQLESLHRQLEALTVDELYPIVKVMAAHIKPVVPAPEAVKFMDGDWDEIPS